MGQQVDVKDARFPNINVVREREIFVWRSLAFAAVFSFLVSLGFNVLTEQQVKVLVLDEQGNRQQTKPGESSAMLQRTAELFVNYMFNYTPATAEDQVKQAGTLIAPYKRAEFFQSLERSSYVRNIQVAMREHKFVPFEVKLERTQGQNRWVARILGKGTMTVGGKPPVTGNVGYVVNLMLTDDMVPYVTSFNQMVLD